ncbi:hypothetical protein V5F79_22460 [Xanthobacter flavus]|uniref:hypothetical protein n=1 Tax=Xanthobacter flavus TaxID=281 RepID=UPI003729A796
MRNPILKTMRAMWQEMAEPEPVTTLHLAYVERHGHPPGTSFVECRWLDARGLPKFRVQAERRATE